MDNPDDRASYPVLYVGFEGRPDVEVKYGPGDVEGFSLPDGQDQWMFPMRNGDSVDVQRKADGCLMVTEYRR